MSQISGGSLTGLIAILLGVTIAISISVLIISGAFDALELPAGSVTTVIPAEEIPNPLTLPNIVALYDAEEDVSIGVGVSQWDDQTGNGNHVVQGTAGNQPTVSTDAINGNDAISFDGVDDYLRDDAFSGGTLAFPVTVGIVLKPDPSTSNALYFAGAQSPGRASIKQDVTTRNLGVFAGATVTSSVAASNDFVLLVLRQNSSNYSNLYENGVLILEPLAGTEGMNGINIGSFYNQASDAEIDVAYLAVYDGTMSDENMDIFEDYVENRFDLGMTIQGDYDPEIIITTGNGTSAWSETQETLSTQAQISIALIALVVIIFAAVIVLRITNRI